MLLHSKGPVTDLPLQTPSSTSGPDPATSSPHWGPLATVLWAALVAIIFIVSQVATVFIYLLVTKSNLSSAELQALGPELKYDGNLLSLSTFITAIVIGPIILIIARLKSGANLKDYLGLHLPSGRDTWRWFLILIAFLILSDVTLYLLKQPIVPDFMYRTYRSMKTPWVLWLALLVGAPFIEELFFRGFVIKGLSTSPLRWQGAVLVSSVAWAFTHVQYDVYGVVLIFALGLVLGIAKVKSGSTLLTMGLHSFVNLGATLETVLHLRSMSP